MYSNTGSDIGFAERSDSMPRKPKKPCAYPGCPNLTNGTYCDKHRKEARRQYDQYERAADVHKKYGRSWKRIRNRYIKEHPFCEECFKDGKMVLAEEVHHILPVSRGGTNEVSNLMALCQSCHTKKHIQLGDRKAYR